MSTISLSYPDVIRVHRVSAIRWIMILSSLVLIAITLLILVISAQTADLTHRTAVSQNSFASIAVPVPMPSLTEIHPISSETPAPYAGETSEPSVVPVPVPTPPSQ